MSQGIVGPVWTTHCGCGNYLVPTRLRSFSAPAASGLGQCACEPWPECQIQGRTRSKEHFAVPLAETCGVLLFRLSVWD
jgi:hypothetical protein